MPHVFIPPEVPVLPSTYDALDAFRPLVPALVFTAMAALHGGQERRASRFERPELPRVRERRGRRR